MSSRAKVTLLVSASLLICACSGSAVTEADGDGGGGSGAAGGGGSGGMGGAADPDRADNEALAACGDDGGCPKGSAQLIEGGSPFSMLDMSCTVSALRDRTPGRHRVSLNHTWSNGQSDEDYTLVITPSGEVEIGMHESTSIQQGPEIEESEDFLPTRRCQPKPASFFDDCLTAIDMGDGSGMVPQEAWDCVYPSLSEPLPWFSSCVEQAPTCQ